MRDRTPHTPPPLIPLRAAVVFLLALTCALTIAALTWCAGEGAAETALAGSVTFASTTVFFHHNLSEQ